MSMTRNEDVTSKLAGKKTHITPPQQQPIKVALVEDQTKARENWTRLINSFPDFTCVCSCISAEDALVNIPLKSPDVVLMDIFAPNLRHRMHSATQGAHARHPNRHADRDGQSRAVVHGIGSGC